MSESAQATYRIGIDVGGTFTDLALLNERTGEASHTKVLTTYPNPDEGVIHAVDRALAAAAVGPDRVTFILHGTTIATNSLLEGKGARTALVTTEGFRDVLEIARQIRPSLFDWRGSKPVPFAPRRRRFELRERVRADGSALIEPTDRDIDAVVDLVLQSEPEAVAVSLLFSFLHPAHEERVMAALHARRPDLAVSISSRVLPEYREYERTSTTVANAFITPLLTAYAARLESALATRGLNAQLRLLQSNGGVGTVAALRDRCISTALSGPAGGVTAAAFLAAECRLDHCISFDMGGTSSDICLIRYGRPEWTVDATIGGCPIRVPMIDVHTVGAGGGSIVWIDRGGGLRVGPRSAGSHPGPACYGFGGTQPTITDAHMEAGSLRVEFFDGKNIPFSREAGTAALAALGAPLGLSAIDVAIGALQVVNHNLAKEIRAASLARGLEASEFTLIPFGGAGQLHACALAEQIAITRVLLPDSAGVLSALGAALADYRYDFSQGFVRRSTAVSGNDLSDGFARLEQLGMQRLADFPVTDVRIERSLDLRYVGQSFEINVPVAGEGALAVQEIVADFHQRHAATYGFADSAEPVDIVNLRLSAFGATRKPRADRRETGGSVSPIREVVAHGPDGTAEPHQVIARDTLQVGAPIVGPAIVHDRFATALVPRGWSGTVDRSGHVLLSWQPASDRRGLNP